jgi:hypothetical protein
MKNTSIAITLGILLISSALLVTIPKNIVAQQAEETMTEEQIKAKLTEFKTKLQSMLLLLQKYPILI